MNSGDLLLGATVVLSGLTLLVLLRRTEARPRPARFKPVPRRVVTPAEVRADPLLSAIAEMLAYHHLHARWNGHEFRTLDLDQRDLWADLIDADHVNRPGGGPDEAPWFVERWWR